MATSRCTLRVRVQEWRPFEHLFVGSHNSVRHSDADLVSFRPHSSRRATGYPPRAGDARPCCRAHDCVRRRTRCLHAGDARRYRLREFRARGRRLIRAHQRIPRLPVHRTQSRRDVSLSMMAPEREPPWSPGRACACGASRRARSRIFALLESRLVLASSARAALIAALAAACPCFGSRRCDRW